MPAKLYLFQPLVRRLKKTPPNSVLKSWINIRVFLTCYQTIIQTPQKLLSFSLVHSSAGIIASYHQTPPSVKIKPKSNPNWSEYPIKASPRGAKPKPNRPRNLPVVKMRLVLIKHLSIKDLPWRGISAPFRAKVNRIHCFLCSILLGLQPPPFHQPWSSTQEQEQCK